jgi:hypothetical protein
LLPIANFFRMKKPPTSDLLQRTATTLQVACGYQPPLIRVRSPSKTRSGGDDDEIEETTVHRNNNKRKKKQPPPTATTTAKPGRMLTPASVPMMTARFVSDLEFGQQVLNYSLALMGLPFVVPEQSHPRTSTNTDDDDDDKRKDDNHTSPSNWMPPSLKAARPDLLVEPSHILGVIVVACRLVPGWDCWSYTRPLDKGHDATFSSSLSKQGIKAKNKTDQVGHFSLHQNSQDDSDGDDSDGDDNGGQPQQREAKRRKVMESQRRFVPWNEAHFRLLGNGKTMEGYLEFLEETIVHHTDVLLPEFVSLLDLSDDQSDEEMSTASSSASQQHSPEQQLEKERGGGDVVRPCPNLVATLPENTSNKTRTIKTVQRGQDGRSTDVVVPPTKKAQQHRYELFQHRSTTSKTTATGTFTPCSPHIGMLIEYMAYKVGVEPFEIEQFCLKLDQEIASRFAKHANVTDMHPLAVFHMADGSLG